MPMMKRSLIILLVLLAAVAFGTIWGLTRSGDGVELAESSRETVQPAQESVMVYVTGAVNNPGLVTLGADARVADAVRACGGLLPTADAEHINMAQEIKDGQQIKVPEKQGLAQKEGKAQADGKAGAQGGRININTADEKELDSLPGVGPSTAKRIIEYRETEGSFQKPEDIKKVKGIGDGKYNKLKDKICV